MSTEFQWNQYWRENGDPIEGNPANLYREREICRIIGNPKPGDTLIDIGSGQGELAIRLGQRYRGLKIIGVEASEEGVLKARDKALRVNTKAQFEVRDLSISQTLDPQMVGVANYAVCTEVLEHVEDPAGIMHFAREYMAKDCKVIVTVPGGPRTAFDRHIGHVGHFSIKKLETVLNESGYAVDNIYAAGFPFFNLYKLLVMARGQAMIRDIDRASDAGFGKSTELAMKIFEHLFRLNSRSSRLGWQIIAVARPTL